MNGTAANGGVRNVIVVGGGLAGLMATIRAAEKGARVDLFSAVPVRRSHSVCAQGGINGAKDTRGEGDTPFKHFDDTIYGGDFLANQTPVKGMCEAAPGIIDMFDRMGVMFNRTPEGLVDMRRFGGTLYHRTAYAGATTGQQLMYALDEQVRRLEAEGLVRKFENREFLSIAPDGEGRCRGITAMNLDSMKVEAFPAGATILCTGGLGMIFGAWTTNSRNSTGSAAGAAYQQGAVFANGEFIQVHPTSIPGEDKQRLMSESARGEGGRIWTYRDGKPWYFLEEWFPLYGNLVPRDVASRAIFKVIFEMKLGVNGENVVFLDLSHMDPAQLQAKLGGILEIYEKFAGDDPKKIPMRVFPAVHYSMGGLWVDFDHMTNVPGLFAAGECEYQYHGANRLGANALLACVYGGGIAGDRSADYAANLRNKGTDSSIFTNEVKRQGEINDGILKSDGSENPFNLWREMGKWMSENVTVIRRNDAMKKTDEKLQELLDRCRRLKLPDSGGWSNQSLVFARRLHNMLHIARVITLGAVLREESRGAHYKPDSPDRNDDQWLKTTRAKHTPDGPAFSYEEVDVRHIPPRPRKYDIE
ncbi:MAG: succinate dehydrogenase flavoprotein subunit [bacterium]